MDFIPAAVLPISGDPGMPPRLDVLQKAWFDKWLKEIDNGVDKYSPITLKQPNGLWISRTGVPTSGSAYRRMFLDGASSGTAPHARADGGLRPTPGGEVRSFTVAPGLASFCSRDAGRISGGLTGIIVACSEDSRIHEQEGLTFTSAPVAEPTTISGPIAVHLNAVHDTKDGYWAVTVNDVAPNGSSRQLSSGQLVASLRYIDESSSRKDDSGFYTDPVAAVDIDKRQTTEPGVPVTLDIATTAIDTTLEPGHRLRLDVFASNFPRGLPPTPVLIDSQLAPQHLQLDPAAPSWINVSTSRSLN